MNFCDSNDVDIDDSIVDSDDVLREIRKLYRMGLCSYEYYVKEYIKRCKA